MSVTFDDGRESSVIFDRSLSLFDFSAVEELSSGSEALINFIGC